MSISFSGLASGLDTSSWVTSLTALKRAKVTELQEERENVLLSKETLNSIKSFFSSFRSTLEKITDVKFNANTSFDVFAQNVATSANPNIVTASATHEAAEGKYDILVDKLATTTKAISNTRYMTTIVETTTATNNSYLKHLGVSAGDIIVRNPQSTESVITIEEDDTIGTFIEKLQNVGITASFNENTGVFSVNIGTDDIDDIGSTGIVDALHLEGVNEGYTSNQLQVKHEETQFSAATNSTKMSELGVSAGSITIEANDASYTFNITGDTTLGTFISNLNSKSIDASLDETTGVFTINDAVITNDGATGLISAFGLDDPTVSTNNQISDALSYTSVTTTTTTATLDTKLVDLGEGVAITGTQTVVVTNANGETSTINVTSSSTLGDLLTGMNNAGLSATLKNDGTVEITGGTITGGTFDASGILGLNEEAYTGYVTGDALTENKTLQNTATLDTKLVEELGVSEGYFKVTTVNDEVKYLKVESGDMISDLITKLSTAEVQGSFDETTGVLTITGAQKIETLTDSQVTSLVSSGAITESDTALRKGTDLLSKLYGQTTIDITNADIAQANATSQALYNTVTQTVMATGSTTLGQLGLGSGQTTATFVVDGTNVTFAISQTMSIDSFIANAQSKGINAQFDESTSKITFGDAELSGTNTAGTLYAIMNPTESVSGKTAVSTVVYTKTTATVTATGSTQLSDLGITSSQTVYIKRPVVNASGNGETTYTFNVSGTTTLDQLMASINACGTTATLKDGVLSIDGGYLVNSALESALGLTTDIDGVSTVIGTKITLQTSTTVSGSTELGEIIDALGTTSSVSSGYSLTFGGQTVSVASDTTLNELMTQIESKGGTASLDSTGRLIVTGGALSGTVANALGITSTTETTGVSTTGSALNVLTVSPVTEDTVIADTYTVTGEKMPTGGVWIFDNAANIVGTVTITSTTTYGDFFDDLSAYGIAGRIDNGTISFSSTNGLFVETAYLDYYGGTSNYSVTANTTSWTSTAAISYTETVTADTTTKLEDLVGSGNCKNDGYYELIFTSDSGTSVDVSPNDSATTLGDVINLINANGGNAYLDSSGKLQVTGGTLSGNVATAMGVVNSTTTVACGYTSTYTMTSQVTEYADTNTKFSELGLGSSVITIFEATTVQGSGNPIGYVTTYAEMTIGDLFAQLSNYGIGGTISNGVITLTPSSDQNWAAGGALNGLGIGTDNTAEDYGLVGLTKTSDVITYDKTVTNIIETTQTITVTTSSTITVDEVTVTTVSYGATRDTLLSDLGVTDFTTIGYCYDEDQYYVCPGGTEKTFTYTSTLGDLIDWINGTVNTYHSMDVGGSISASLTAGVLQVKVSGGASPFFYYYQDMYPSIDTSNAGGILDVLNLSTISETGVETVAETRTAHTAVTYTKKEGNTAYSNWVSNPMTELSFQDLSGAQTFRLDVYNAYTGELVNGLQPLETENVLTALDSFIVDSVGGCLTYEVETDSGNERLVLTPVDGYYIEVQGLYGGGYTEATSTLSMATTLGDLGLSQEVFTCIRYNNASIVYNYTFNESSTLQDIEDTLNCSLSVTDGKLKIISNRYYISWSSEFADAVNINETESYGVYNYQISNSDALYQYKESTTVTPVEQTITSTGTQTISAVTTEVTTTEELINGNTTFAELGMTSTNYFTVFNNGTYYTITIGTDSTVSDMQMALFNKGIQVDINEGKVTFSSTDPRHICLYGSSTELADIFGISFSMEGVGTWSENTVYYYQTMDSSNQLTVTTSQAVTGETRIYDLMYDGYNLRQSTAEGSVDWFVQPTGAAGFSITMSDVTINDIIAEFEDNGIHATLNANGTLSLSSDIYSSFTIEDAESSGETLKFFFGTQNVSSSATTSSTSSTSALKETKITNLNMETVLSTIGVSSGNLRVVDSAGKSSTITVDATKTLGDFALQMANCGFSLSVSNGKVAITSNGNASLSDVSTNIVSKLNLSENTSGLTYHNSFVGHVDDITVTLAANGTTSLQNLRYNNIALTKSAANNFSVVLSTAADGISNTKTLTFAGTSTVNDVISELSKYGITASMSSSGEFIMTSSTLDDFSLTNVSGGGNLATALYSDSNKVILSGVTTNRSTLLSDNTTINMTDDTLLSDIGVTSGTTIFYMNGEYKTINVSNTDSVAAYRAALAGIGITSSVIDGKLSLSADGVVYATNSGTSNAVSKFGISDTNWNKGFYSQTGKALTDTEESVVYANMKVKLSDLTGSTGTSLGISSGTIYAYKDGTAHLVTIDANETLESLATKLSAYSITVGMTSDGKIHFNGDGNSYLTTSGITSGASNILAKLGVSTWTTSNSSTSSSLKYKTTTNETTLGTTLMGELKDSSGASIGITTGKYYIYSNGTKYEATITASTTVNDFLGTLNSYGLSATLNSDGSITIGGSNNSYIATASDLGSGATNVVTKLFGSEVSGWDVVGTTDKSNGLTVFTTTTSAITEDTKLSDINEGTYQAGYITVVKDGVSKDIYLSADDTVGTLMKQLELNGFDTVLNSNGELTVKSTGNSYIQEYAGTDKSNVLDLFNIGSDEWIQTNLYTSETVDVIKTTTADTAVTRETALSELGITTGEYYIYNNGVKYTAMVSSDETVGSFLNTLATFGIQGNIVTTGDSSVIELVGSGDSYVTESNSTINASNITDILFPTASEKTYDYSGTLQTSSVVTTWTNATEETLLSDLDVAWGNDTLKAAGDLSVTVDGVTSVIKIEDDETFGSLKSKIEELGVEVTLADGKLMIQSGYKDFTINSDGTTSSIVANLGLVYHDDLGGYMASSAVCEQTITTIEERTRSVANWADYSTKMSMMNISSGTLSVFRNGQKAVIEVNSDETFGQLRSRIAAAFSDVDIEFEDGYLKFYSNSGAVVEVGTSSDTSNISAICGFVNDKSGVVKSARELYKVNGDSKITQSGIFRYGDVTEGCFTLGDAVFTITSETTLNDLIRQINSSEEAQATASWDSVDGKLVIQSRKTGSAYINIEAGWDKPGDNTTNMVEATNFTNIMGFTTSQINGSKVVTDGKLDAKAQEIGENAVFQINGTTYVSTSNTVDSSVSRIQGLTINLHDVSNGEAVELTVKRDSETISNAVSDLVDAYNALIENVDKEIAAGAQLSDQSSLKFLRNQIRSLMTSTFANNGVYKNLDAIGISLDAASASNIRTDNINVLSFNKDKFVDAFNADRTSLKTLLVGDGSQNSLGLLGTVERVVESALEGGYFTSAEKSYNNEIQRLDTKIERANSAVERYKTRLETKFQAMDLLISKMQNQYSSFLGT